MSSNDKKQNSDNLPERMGQSEPAASSELAQRPQHLPEKVGHSATTISIANMACKPLPEFEAELTIELDRISELGDRDPLAALDNIIAMMQGLNLEVVKLGVGRVKVRDELDRRQRRQDEAEGGGVGGKDE